MSYTGRVRNQFSAAIGKTVRVAAPLDSCEWLHPFAQHFLFAMIWKGLGNTELKKEWFSIKLQGYSGTYTCSLPI